MHRTIGDLPERERETFDLHWYQGLTLEETAGVLGVSTGEVNTPALRLYGAVGFEIANTYLEFAKPA